LSGITGLSGEVLLEKEPVFSGSNKEQTKALHPADFFRNMDFKTAFASTIVNSFIFASVFQGRQTAYL